MAKVLSRVGSGEPSWVEAAAANKILSQSGSNIVWEQSSTTRKCLTQVGSDIEWVNTSFGPPTPTLTWTPSPLDVTTTTGTTVLSSSFYPSYIYIGRNTVPTTAAFTVTATMGGASVPLKTSTPNAGDALLGNTTDGYHFVMTGPITFTFTPSNTGNAELTAIGWGAQSGGGSSVAFLAYSQTVPLGFKWTPTSVTTQVGNSVTVVLSCNTYPTYIGMQVQAGNHLFDWTLSGGGISASGSITGTVAATMIGGPGVNVTMTGPVTLTLTGTGAGTTGSKRNFTAISFPTTTSTTNNGIAVFESAETAAPTSGTWNPGSQKVPTGTGSKSAYGTFTPSYTGTHYFWVEYSGSSGASGSINGRTIPLYPTATVLSINLTAGTAVNYNLSWNATSASSSQISIVQWREASRVQALSACYAMNSP